MMENHVLQPYYHNVVMQCNCKVNQIKSDFTKSALSEEQLNLSIVIANQQTFEMKFEMSLIRLFQNLAFQQSH